MTRFSPSFDQKFVVGSIPKEVAEEATPAAVPEHGPRNFIVEENLAEEPTFILRNAPLNSSETRFNQQREYGPRSLKIRKKRSGISNEINEIDPSFDEETTTLSQTTETERYITTILPSTENSTTTVGPTSTIISFPDKVSSFIDLVKELVHFKAKLGLQVIQNITQSISKYITRAQARLDEHYRKYSKSNN
ncbi:hypothetical protein NQ318_010960 [Aromia moschata]|uniref:Uncharacterized protein n=1 Tax=Aromia moschata TaxID=1265417 RepID=A0AAV8YM88_9CUCU|nr:hypothetical protein NQ318_010960 [Aromia moschata]